MPLTDGALARIQSDTLAESQFFSNTKRWDRTWGHRESCDQMAKLFTEVRQNSVQIDVDASNLPFRAIVIADRSATGQGVSRAARTMWGGRPLFNQWGYAQEPIACPYYEISNRRGFPEPWSREERVRANSEGGTENEVAAYSAPPYIENHGRGSYREIIRRIEEIAPDRARQMGIADLLLNTGALRHTVTTDVLGKSSLLANNDPKPAQEKIATLNAIYDHVMGTWTCGSPQRQLRDTLHSQYGGVSDEGEQI